MIVLSLDLSLNCSGFAIFDTKKRNKKEGKKESKEAG